MQRILCTIHDFTFGFEPTAKVASTPVRCPLCLAEQVEKVSAVANEAIQHRDLLLKAIDLKKLLQPLEPTR
jgi:hypothetical protein